MTHPSQPDPPLTPRSGDDATFDIVDTAIADLGLRRDLWMGDPRNMIHLVASIIDQAERCLPHLVAEARADGCTWSAIAGLLGTDPEHARRRFDPASDEADTRWMLDPETQ